MTGLAARREFPFALIKASRVAYNLSGTPLKNDCRLQIADCRSYTREQRWMPRHLIPQFS
jgi:hypothetical protein